MSRALANSRPLPYINQQASSPDGSSSGNRTACKQPNRSAPAASPVASFRISDPAAAGAITTETS